MLETAQIAILFILLVVCILLLVLGIQVFFILKEFRKTIAKANKVLDDTSVVTGTVSEQVSSFSGIVTGLKTGAMIFDLLKGRKKKNEE